MNQVSLARLAVCAGLFFCLTTLLAQDKTPPASAEEKEAAYTLAVNKRADAILTELALSDTAKAARIKEIVIAQYRALRARDEAIEKNIQRPGATITEMAQKESKALHDQFIASLAKDLTSEQIEQVKDKMTYGKVKFTFDAYCSILPDLTEKEKAKILEYLRQAREEAIDGGSASNKSATFQKYKEKINEYLKAEGRDVAKATEEWSAKQEKLAKEKKEAAK